MASPRASARMRGGSSTAAGHIQGAGLAVVQDEVPGITNGSVSASIVRVRVRHPSAVSRVSAGNPVTSVDLAFSAGQGRTSSVSSCAMAVPSGTLSIRIATNRLPRSASCVRLAGAAGLV